MISKGASIIVQQNIDDNEHLMDPVDEDENLFELEIKNLDTNEVFKM